MPLPKALVLCYGRKKRPATKAHSLPNNGTIASRNDDEIPPILNLPREIRDQIYRILLSSTEYISRPVNPQYQPQAFGATEDTLSPTRPGGPIHAQNIWKQNSRFEVSILRVNRQIYWEASSIFRSENIWYRISINIPDYGLELKNLGYGVVACGAASISFKASVDVKIKFQTIPHDDQIRDIFVLSLEGHEMLSRALRYTCGTSHGVPTFEFAKCSSFNLLNEKSKDLALGNHGGLRPSDESQPYDLSHLSDQALSAKIILGSFNLPSPRRLCWYLSMTMESFDNDHPRGRRSFETAGKLELALALYNDCRLIRGPSFFSRATPRVWRRLRCVIVRLLLALIDIEMYLGRYSHVIIYVKYALRSWKFLPRSEAHMILLRAQAKLKIYPNPTPSSMRDMRFALDLLTEGQAIGTEMLKLVAEDPVIRDEDANFSVVTVYRSQQSASPIFIPQRSRPEPSRTNPFYNSQPSRILNSVQALESSSIYDAYSGNGIVVAPTSPPSSEEAFLQSILSQMTANQPEISIPISNCAHDEGHHENGPSCLTLAQALDALQSYAARWNMTRSEAMAKRDEQLKLLGRNELWVDILEGDHIELRRWTQGPKAAQRVEPLMWEGLHAS